MANGSFLSAEGKRGLTLVSLPFIYALLLLAIPIGAVVLFSFWTQDFMTIDTTFTLNNYREIWAEPIYGSLLKRSVFVSGLVTMVTVLAAFPVAYYISFHLDPKHKSLWLFLITIPFWTSYLIRVFLWKVILGYNGVVNTSLMELGIITEPLTFILYNVNAVIITLAHAYAPFAILPIFVALEKIDRSLLEAGRDLGETPFMTFLRVTLPLAMPGVVSAIMIVFIPTIGDYVTPSLLGGPEGKMVANLVQLQYLKLDNYPMGSATAVSSMAMVGIALIVGFAQAKLFRRVYTAFMGSTNAGLSFLTALATVVISFGACVFAGWALNGAFFAVVLAVAVGHIALLVWLKMKEAK